MYIKYISYTNSNTFTISKTVYRLSNLSILISFLFAWPNNVTSAWNQVRFCYYLIGTYHVSCSQIPCSKYDLSVVSGQPIWGHQNFGISLNLKDSLKRTLKSLFTILETCLKNFSPKLAAIVMLLSYIFITI